MLSIVRGIAYACIPVAIIFFFLNFWQTRVVSSQSIRITELEEDLRKEKEDHVATKVKLGAAQPLADRHGYCQVWAEGMPMLRQALLARVGPECKDTFVDVVNQLQSEP